MLRKLEMNSFKKGIFIISLDTELAWGNFDNGKLDCYREHFAKTRDIIDKLLKLFEKYKISATWAIVGHLFLDHCKKRNNLAHKDIVRPNYKWFQEDWFSFDPCSNIEKDPFWYGKDIVKKIKNCKVPQEIASHSFSHIIFGDKGCSKEAAISDIKKSKEVARDLGVELKSFVFPRNSIDYLDVLGEMGFHCYRGQNDIWYEKNESLPTIGKKILRFIYEIFVTSPPSVLPKWKEDLMEIPASMQYRSFDSFWRLVPVQSRVSRAKKGIDKAIKQKRLLHIWFHPFNLGVGTEKLLQGIEEIIAYTDAMRKRGELDILPMYQVYKLLLVRDKNETPSPQDR